MSRVSPHRFTVRRIDSLPDGRWCDGGNLWLSVQGDRRTWCFRFTSPRSGKRREMGLGAYPMVSLAAARRQAAGARLALHEGADPIEQRNAHRIALQRQQGPAFREVATRYIAEQTPGWRDPRRAAIWTSSLDRLAFSQLGNMPVDAIATDDVLAVLRPIWPTINETADRVRSRIERILEYARTRGWRAGENPARWKGHLEHILPKPSAVSPTVHQPAIPWQDMRTVMARLIIGRGVSPLVVRFICLTAARSSEARGATWSEIDMQDRLWTVPAARIKASREHRVPLSVPAMQILRMLHELPHKPTDLVFPGGRLGRPMSDVAVSKALHGAAKTRDVTVHGLRSTFRDWAAEATDHPREVAEMALAHVVGNQVEAAYRRGDLFGKRRQLMDDWAAFLCAADATEQGNDG